MSFKSLSLTIFHARTLLEIDLKKNGNQTYGQRDLHFVFTGFRADGELIHFLDSNSRISTSIRMPILRRFLGHEIPPGCESLLKIQHESL